VIPVQCPGVLHYEYEESYEVDEDGFNPDEAEEIT
jgi:hypothetical protein